MTLTRVLVFAVAFGGASAAHAQTPPRAAAAQEAAAAAREMAARAQAISADADIYRLKSETIRMKAALMPLAAEAVMLSEGVRPLALEAAAIAAYATAWDFGSAFQEVRAKGRADDRESRLYAEARNALDKAQWERAIGLYNEVAALKGERADAALYWKAFAQDRQGLRAEALTTLAALSRDYPKSRYLSQAKVLEAEIRQNAGQPVRPQDQTDEDVKLLALNALQHTAPEQAVPMLDKLLRGAASPRLKERALFVLAQSDSPQARELLSSIARGGSTPDLQGRAILYLAQHGGAQSSTVLAEVYSSTTDSSVKRTILRAFMISGDKARVLTAAQSERDPDLRTEAIRQLGVMNANDELWQLYQREQTTEVKKQIIRALFVGDNVSRMSELARTEKDPDLRREAIRNLGLMDEKGTADTLVAVYNAERDADVKRAVIHALGIGDQGEALVALARKESDASLRAEIVRRLSTMAEDNRAARDYMLEILGGK